MEKQYDLFKLFETINFNIDIDEGCCNFFYTMSSDLLPEKHKEIKQALDYFISKSWAAEKIIFLTPEQIPHELNYHEKQNFFKSSYLYVIDGLDINTNNFHKVASLHDCTKDLKTAFLYVNTPKSLRDYMIQSEQYKLRTYTFRDMDNDFIAFKRYHELMDKIENKPENTHTKKKI